MAEVMSADQSVRPELWRRITEPLAWWTVLLAVYLALVSAVSVLEIAVGAGAAAVGAAVAVAGRRALFSGDTGRGGEPASGAVRVPGRSLPLVWLPSQIVADTARVVVRGAGGGSWVPLGVAAGTGARAAATLLVSTSPGAYVGGVDPERGVLRVHRLASGPSAFERRLADAGLVTEPARDGRTS
ncbi:hypothetical protein [Actinomadura meridiana]